MSSLNAIELLNKFILLDKVVDLSSWSIFQIGLSNLIRNRFFFWGGGEGDFGY